MTGLPANLRRVLDAAIALERADGRDAEAAALERHYAEVMPRMRAAQLVDPLFTTALDWARLPRLSGAIARLTAVVVDAGLDPRDVLGEPRAAATLAELYARTHYGGAMPMLYGYPADLAYLAARGADAVELIDRYLVAPVIHELCHFARDRTVHLPIHLDECVGGWLGVHVHPAFAYPASDENDAIYAAPWLAQVGQAIVRAFGIRAVIRTHAGVERGLPPAFLDDVARLAREDWATRRSAHLLADPRDPEPWLALIEPYLDAADPAVDRAILEDALRAMCLVSEVVDGSFRTRSVVPAAPITIRDRRVRCGDASYWIPLDLQAELVITSLDDVPRLASAAIDG
ncbi:MAG: hypothetical protein NT062_14680 [Proteobacteria bacterium]|nr:hypothetical protein [Pseudomonadota bacterium]